MKDVKEFIYNLVHELLKDNSYNVVKFTINDVAYEVAEFEFRKTERDSYYNWYIGSKLHIKGNISEPFIIRCEEEKHDVDMTLDLMGMIETVRSFGFFIHFNGFHQFLFDISGKKLIVKSTTNSNAAFLPEEFRSANVFPIEISINFENTTMVPKTLGRKLLNFCSLHSESD